MRVNVTIFNFIQDNLIMDDEVVYDGRTFVNVIRELNPNLVTGDVSLTKEDLLILMKTVCRHVLETPNSDQANQLISLITDYIHGDDVKYFVLNSLLTTFKDMKREEQSINDRFTQRGFKLLTAVKMVVPGQKKRKRKLTDEEIIGLDENMSGSTVLVTNPPTIFLTSSLSYGKLADLFASVWLLFLSFKMSVKLYKGILKIMDTKIMPHFRNPLSLADFLIESYNIGGSASLLSLSSLFILIQKCNLEYPDFYQKLYALLKPDILYVKYRARFFYWTDIFLSSTALPAYLVAAFAKKLSRLALTAPVDAIIIFIPLIGNLLVRHRSLCSLIDFDNKQAPESDPFDFNEEDPAKSNAMESHLWELKSLLCHWNSRVDKKVSFIRKAIPKKEWDLSDLLETSFDEILVDASKAIENPDIEITPDEKITEKLKTLTDSF